jgi:hypothetical protein
MKEGICYYCRVKGHIIKEFLRIYESLSLKFSRAKELCSKPIDKLHY